MEVARSVGTASRAAIARKRSAGKMCSDTCVAESPKPMAKPFEGLADYGSATLYILMEVARSVGTALRAAIATTIVAD